MKYFRVCAIVAALLLSACGRANVQDNVGKAAACSVLDYQNGVYYFDCTEANFGNALSQFIASHPNLSLVTLTGNGTGGHYGTVDGYFAVFQILRR
ncbi:hypothetical protein A2318_00720 [Candidatus Uhrbacteria bacterium RIFOXYB2_FULL_45_11]|uniref:Lipoprotein n=1 Tax=Candidatus Uhrbacteria bacterium RIFOXYB2_FULL_45_11 TaxID=1802421 RepID=A0A1F7W2T9_9BACT|nr:MAG: hypothetical protein A2318_00720 [Candidatus Uhrbacteria bacterium RIFOXYB2_FULL_45_11]